MRFIVCGGRDFDDSRKVFRALDVLRSLHGFDVLVHGACPTGADAMAARWAEIKGVRVEVHPADWERHGRRAGPVRNQAMANAGADGCIAFPGGNGTEDMVRRAIAAGIKVWRPYG